MPQTSSVNTAAVSISATALAPYVDWAFHNFQGLPPAGADVAVAGLLVTAGHLLYNIVATWLVKKGIQIPDEPPAPPAAPAANS